jgi:hypothetical protein
MGWLCDYVNLIGVGLPCMVRICSKLYILPTPTHSNSFQHLFESRSPHKKTPCIIQISFLDYSQL